MALPVRVAKITALINGTQKTVKVLVVDEGEEISISYNGTIATIDGLESINIEYTGTTAEIGG